MASEKRDGSDRGKPSVIVYGVFLSIVIVIIIFTSLFISLILDGVYDTGPAVNRLVYLIPVSSAVLALVIMIAAHSYYGRPMFPLYLASTLIFGVLFYLFVASVLSAIPLALYQFGIVRGEAMVAFLSYMIPIMALVPMAVGLVNSRFLRVRRVEITSGRIKKGVRIVFFSDLHLGLLVGKRRMEELIEVCERAKPDMIMIGGDLIDTEPSNIEKVLPLVGKLPEIAHTYAVTGNHEYFNDVDACVEAMESNGIEVLRNRCVKDRSTGFLVCGVDDPTGSMQFGEEEPDPERILKGRRGNKILMAHQPRYFKSSASLGVDLMLSGHTHGGQMEPFGLATRAAYSDGDRGLRRMGDTHVYVSTGAGTWGPPVRFLTSSEVVVLDIVPDG